MKQLTENIKLLDIDDISALRKIRFEGYLLRHFANSETTVISEIREKILSFVNSGDLSSIVITIQNYSLASEQLIKGLPDSLYLAFSMLTLYKDENQKEISEPYHVQKIQEIMKEGISYSVIRDEVLNFIIRHPADFRNMSEAVKIMNEILSNDNLHEDTSEY